MPSASRKAPRASARKSRKAAAANRYETHHNGDRPFTVTVIPSKKELIIGDKVNNLIKATKYRQIWIGNTKSPVGAPRAPGHSILAELPSGEILFVAEKVMSFHLEKGDTPVKYVSYIGNSDSVYAYLVGTYNTYMLTEQVYIPNEHLNPKEDAYKGYYVAGAAAYAKKFSRRPHIMARAAGVN